MRLTPLLLFLFSVRSHEHTTFEDWGDTRYGELFPINIEGVEDTDYARPALKYSRRRLPMQRELKFAAVGKGVEVKVDLSLDLVEVWGHKAVIHATEDHDLADRSYRGSGSMSVCEDGKECVFYGEIELASVTFFDAVFGEHVFHAKLRLPHEEWTVEPRQLVEKEKFANGADFPSEDSALAGLEAEMYLFESGKNWVENTDPETGYRFWDRQRRRLQNCDPCSGAALEVFTDCYPGQDIGTTTYRISMGMLVDQGFYQVAGNNVAQVANYIESMMNDVNTMYGNQMGVEITPTEIVLSGSARANELGFDSDGTTANNGMRDEAPATLGTKTCPSGLDPSARLTQLRNWRYQNLPEEHGLWHLMTHCHPPAGTVGIAYISALCSSFVGVGLSNWLGSTATWEVVAHEFGHNFGSGHTFDAVPGINGAGGIMDYGDGLFNGIYQFHPVHKNEVCQEIRDSMAVNNNIPNCWESGPTGGGGGATVTHQWRSTGQFPAAPANACGDNVYVTENIECREVDLTECDFTPTDTSSCSAQNAQLLSDCDSTVVQDTLCSASCKPTPTTQRVTNLPTCQNTCGNGFWDEDEYCEPGGATGESCCASSCTAWSTTAACQGTNPIIDAAVMDYDQRLFLFQGNQFMAIDYTQNADGTTTETPVEGYPRLLSSIDNLDASYQNGISAAASFYDNLVLLFNGLDLVLVDMDEMEQIGDEYTGDAVFAYNDFLLDCGTIDAVVSYYATLELICGNTANLMTFNANGGGETTDDRSVESRFGALGFPSTLDTAKFGAAVRNPVTGELIFYKGNRQSVLSSGGQATVTRPGFFENGQAENNCAVDNCDQCSSSNNNLCDVCDTGFTRRRRGRICRGPATFVEIDFDEEEMSEWTGFFYNAAYGDEYYGLNNGGWDTAGVMVEGVSGQGAKLNGNERLRMQPVEFDEPVEHWKVSFWWKPEEHKREKFLTLNRINEDGFAEALEIWFAHESDSEPIVGSTFAIELSMYGMFLDCYVARPIEVGEWNKISVEINRGKIITSANGLKHEVGFELGADDISADFTDWYIGEYQNGISGTIDMVQVQNLGLGDGSGAWPVWAQIIFSIFVIMVIIALFYLCLHMGWLPESVENKAPGCGCLSALSCGCLKRDSASSVDPIGEPHVDSTPSKPTKAAPAIPVRPSGNAPPKPGQAPPKPGKRPPPKPRSSGYTAPPRSSAMGETELQGVAKPSKPPPPPPGKGGANKAKKWPPVKTSARGAGLDLGMSKTERRESWQI